MKLQTAKESEVEFHRQVTGAIVIFSAALGLINTLLGVNSYSNGVIYLFLCLISFYLLQNNQAKISAVIISWLLFITFFYFLFNKSLNNTTTIFLICISVLIAGLTMCLRSAIFFLTIEIIFYLSHLFLYFDTLNNPINNSITFIQILSITSLILSILYLYSVRLYELYSQQTIHQKELEAYTKHFENLVTQKINESQKAIERNYEKLHQLAELGKQLAIVTHDVGNSLSSLRLIFDQNYEILDNRDKRQMELCFSKIESMLKTTSTYKEKNNHRTRINRSVEHCLNQLERNIVRNQIFVVTKLTDSSINLPEDTFERMLNNLLVNSIDALKTCERKRKLIHITGCPKKKYYNLIVEDNGEGIAPEILPLLPQSWLSTKGEDHLGMGLASIQEILRLFPGCGLQLESKSQKGTSVTLTIPIY